MPKKIVTCVYCGHAYPANTPTHGVEILTEHIRICEKHPMRKLEKEKFMLREALVALVGSDKRDELVVMEMVLRSAEAPEKDKVAGINAIHAILETM